MLSSSSSIARSEAVRSAALGPVGELAHLLLHLVDGDGDLLEELVDFVGVVPPKAVTKLDFSQDFGRQIHASGCYRAFPGRWWMPASQGLQQRLSRSR